MFYDLAIRRQPENVDCSVILVAWPVLEAMEDNQFSLSDGTFHLHTFTGIFPSHPLELGDEAVRPGRDEGIVLNVFRPDISLDGLPGATLVEHHGAKRQGVLLVAS